MTRRKSAPMEMIEDIKPDRLYRTTLSNQIFGYGQQRTKDLIDAGELPLPFPLSPSSRYRGWLGAQIIEHRACMRLWKKVSMVHMVGGSRANLSGRIRQR
jgi:hypothetical protein